MTILLKYPTFLCKREIAVPHPVSFTGIWFSTCCITGLASIAPIMVIMMMIGEFCLKQPAWTTPGVWQLLGTPVSEIF